MSDEPFSSHNVRATSLRQEWLYVTTMEVEPPHSPTVLAVVLTVAVLTVVLTVALTVVLTVDLLCSLLQRLHDHHSGFI